MPVESVWRFYPKLAAEIVVKTARIFAHGWSIYWTYRRVAAEPNGMNYTDLAMTPVTDDETDHLEMFTQNDAARHAVDHIHKVKTLTSAA